MYYIILIYIYISDQLLSPKTIVSDDNRDINSIKNRKLSDKVSKGALHIMKNNTKIIVLPINEGKAHKDIRHHKIMDRKNVQHQKTLKRKHQHISFNKTNSHDYTKKLISINNNLHLVAQIIQQEC